MNQITLETASVQRAHTSIKDVQSFIDNILQSDHTHPEVYGSGSSLSIDGTHDTAYINLDADPNDDTPKVEDIIAARIIPKRQLPSLSIPTPFLDIDTDVLKQKGAKVAEILILATTSLLTNILKAAMWLDSVCEETFKRVHTAAVWYKEDNTRKILERRLAEAELKKEQEEEVTHIDIDALVNEMLVEDESHAGLTSPFQGTDIHEQNSEALLVSEQSFTTNQHLAQPDDRVTAKYVTQESNTKKESVSILMVARMLAFKLAHGEHAVIDMAR